MRRRKCLLCLASCPSPLDHCSPAVKSEGGSKMVMAGAVNCDLLQRQLEHVFILRKILDLPETWLEETLLEEEGTDGGGGGPASWFAVCGKCLEERVTPAWKVYQQILALDVKLMEIKEGIRKKMREEMGKKYGDGGGGLEAKIRMAIFPDFKWTNLEDEEEEDVPLDFEMDLDDPDLNSDLSSEHRSEEEFTPEMDPLWDASDNHKPIIPGRRRGRRPTKKPVPLGEKRGRGRPRNPNSLTNLHRKRRKRRIRGILQQEKHNTNLETEDTPRNKKWNWFCCPILTCRARYTSPEELTSHSKLHLQRQESPNELDCPHCDFPGRDQEELDLHIENRHLKSSRILKYICPLCPFTIDNDFTSLKIHFDQNHPSGIDDPSSDLPVTCPICSRRCENLRYFTVHQRKMHPESLGIHLQSLSCHECGMLFTNPLDLRTHVNAEHKRPSKYVCEECGKGYQFLSRLEAHKIMHVNKWKRDYVCHLCGLDYAYKYVLESHYKQCHPSYLKREGEEDGGEGEASGGKFKCRYCELTFPFKGILIRHLQQHKEEQGFKCEECGKSYVNEAGLKRHLKINHPKIREEIPCPYCMKPFVSTEYMRDHVTKFCKMKKIGREPLTAQVQGEGEGVEVVREEFGVENDAIVEFVQQQQLPLQLPPLPDHAVKIDLD